MTTGTSQQDLESLARFPNENPNPVLRCSGQGVVLYANDGAKAVLDAWGIRVGDEVPERIRLNIDGALRDDEVRALDIDCGDSQLCRIEIMPVVAEGYVNIYGKDVTLMRRIERAFAHHADMIRAPLNRLIGAADHLFDAVSGDETLAYDLEALRESGREVIALLNEVSRA